MRGSGPGDLLRTIDVLRPKDEATLAAIAALLGVEGLISVAEPVAPPPGRAKRRKETADEAIREARPSRIEPPPGLKGGFVFEPSAMEEAAEEAVLRRVRGPASTPPFWAQSAGAFTERALGLAPREPAAAPPPDLFAPQWTRAILAALLATARRDGEVDVPVLVQRLLNGEALKRVPRRPRPTLASGVQLFVDCSDAMAPFHTDTTRIVAQITALAGGDSVDEVRFDGNPMRRAARVGEIQWRDYRHRGASIGELRPLTPVAGTRIVCLTDLGIGRTEGAERASAIDWLEFAEHVRRARCPLACLVPYDSPRWPPALRGRLTIVQWDRGSTAASVARAVRRRAWRRERA